MSYDSSQLSGIKAIQIDTDSNTVLSMDISLHTETTILARNTYLIDSKIRLSTRSSSTGYLLWESWGRFSFMGGIYRANAVSTINTGADDSNVTSNAPNTSLTLSQTSAGGGTITRKSFRSFWRL
jgi:hypothetical protein